MKVANRHLPIALQRGSPDLIRAVHRFLDRLRGGMTRATPVEASPSLSVIASSPLYRSKPGVDKCVDHRICVPAAFYEEKPR